MIFSTFRTATVTVGTIVAAHGATTQDQMTALGGALAVLIAGGLGLYSQYRNKQHVAAALLATPPSGAASGN